MDNKITPENFWVQEQQARKYFRRRAWQANKLRSVAALGLSVLYRIVCSYLVIPPVLVFCFFVMGAYEDGVVSTFNYVFVESLEPITVSGADQLIQFWHLFASCTFGLSWLFFIWKSPAAREADRLMDKWWFLHGDKALGLPKQENSVNDL